MHWLTLVLVPRDTTRVKRRVAQLLSPPQDRVFPEYPVECGCIGWAARRHGLDCVDQSREGKGLLERLREARATGDDVGEAQILRQRWEAADAVARGHPLYARPDPDCDLCVGTGTYMVSRSPREKWDYWRTGGRWDGVVLGTPRREDEGNSGKEHERLEYNSVPVTELPDDLLPAAIVTPDGMWHEDPYWGYNWRHPEGEKLQTWRDEARELLQRYRDCLAVAVDCHS